MSCVKKKYRGALRGAGIVQHETDVKGGGGVRSDLSRWAGRGVREGMLGMLVLGPRVSSTSSHQVYLNGVRPLLMQSETRIEKAGFRSVIFPTGLRIALPSLSSVGSKR